MHSTNCRPSAISPRNKTQLYAEFSANIDASEAAKNPANQPAATINTPAPNKTTQPSINTSPEPGNIITPPINPTPEPNTTAQPTVDTQLSQNNTTQPSVNTSNEPYTTAQPNVDTQPAPNNTTQPSINTSNEPNHTEQPDVDTQTEANHTSEPTDTTSSPQKARSKKSNIESLAHIFALSTMFSPGVIPLSDSEVGNFLDGFTTISGDIFSYSRTIRLGYSLIIKMAYSALSDTRLDCIDAGDETICHRASEHYEHFFGFGLYLRQDFIGSL